MMEKILLVLDMQDLNRNSIDFACYLALLTGSRITGIFLENIEEREEITTVVEQNIHLFRESCVCRGVRALVHRDRGVPLKEVVEESRFADLIVVDADTSFSERRRGSPTLFVREVLFAAECPVVIAPYSFESIDEIYFAYNGSRSSVFAIKQFTYLFPGLRAKRISVVNVRQDEERVIEEPFKMKEWLKNHYAEIRFDIRKGDPADELFGYLLDRKNGLVVMGAYGRGILSQLLKPSHAKLVLKATNLPVFITHL